MTRTLVPALVLLLVSTASAHHSYGDILREQSVTISGLVDDIEFVNPHVRMQVRADDGVVYAIEWGNITQLTRGNVGRETVRTGDRLLITGSPHRDPEKKLLTLLTEIKRPADGWTWTKAGPAPTVPR